MAVAKWSREVDATASEFGRTVAPLGAAQLLSAADAYWRKIRVRRLQPLAQPHEEEVQAVRAQLGEDPFARAWNEGEAMDMARVFAYALEEV